MCGLSAALNVKQCKNFLKTALSRLEYRGYDSFGLVTSDRRFRPGRTCLFKEVGKLKDSHLEKQSKSFLNGSFGLCHTRWSSSSVVSSINTHPILGGKINQKPGVFVVHNGNIENYEELRDELEDLGYNFTTETDTEALAHYLDYLAEKESVSLLNKLQEQIPKKFKGRMAFAAIVKKYPGQIFLGSFGLPILISACGKYAGSDPSVFIGYAEKYWELENSLYSMDGTPLNKLERERHDGSRYLIPSSAWPPLKLVSDKAELAQISPHRMLDEIREQVNLVKQNITFPPKLLKRVYNGLNDVTNLHLFGCGSSYNAALMGQLYLENMAGIPTEVSYASHLQDRKPKFSKLLALSQSGETADVLGALEKISPHSECFSLVNNLDSSLARKTLPIDIGAGKEIAVAATKTFTMQCLGLLRLAKSFNYTVHRNDDGFAQFIKLLSEGIFSLIHSTGPIEQVAQKVSRFPNMLFLGRGYNYPIALEGALKMKEVSYIHAEGMHSAEMKHGSISLIEPKCASVFIIGSEGVNFDKVLMNIKEIRARGGKILIIGTGEAKNLADWYIEVPFLNNIYLEPLLMNVALQLLSYYVAIDKGLNPDFPRNLAKACVVE